MKIEIKEYCIRCGMCASLYPELFAFNYEDDKIDVLRDPDTAELEQKAKDAVRDCAITAIYLQK